MAKTYKNRRRGGSKKKSTSKTWGKFGSVCSQKNNSCVRIGTSKAFNIINRDLSHIPNKELSKWAISWSTLSGVVDATIVGCKNKDQLLSNISSISSNTYNFTFSCVVNKIILSNQQAKFISYGTLSSVACFCFHIKFKYSSS